MPASKSKSSEKLAARVSAMELAANNLPVGVGLFHLDGRPIFMNALLSEFYGLDKTTLKSSMTFKDLIENGAFDDWKIDPATHFARVWAALDAGEDYRADVEVGDRIISVHDKRLPGDLLLSTQQDITQRVKAERQVRHMANHDALTGLPNRSAFAQHLDDTIRYAGRRRGSFAVLSVDIDHFKDVNDVFGHAAGDALLKEMAQRFRRCAGDGFLARLGGDEFTFIISEGHFPEAAISLADRLLEVTAEEMLFEGQSFMVGLSVGIALYPTDGDSAGILLSNADAALYRAKADGRGVIRSFEPHMDKKIHQQRRMQQDLKLALARKEFRLYFQPQADMTRKVYGFEALLRWRHPSRGVVGPEEFIPIAEESGLIVDIGQWVLREACREAASWTQPLTISVNVSPIQFRHGDLSACVHAILLETGLSPGRLEIEVTEGVLVHDFSRALSQLRKLKNLGIRIAMDDFGTGYSSLSYLQAFPFDTLKIDKSFVTRLGQSDSADEIVRAVIGLGRGLKLPIVAEGVETAAQLDFLMREQCQKVQGYLIGHPRPIENYAAVTGSDSQPAASFEAQG